MSKVAIHFAGLMGLVPGAIQNGTFGGPARIVLFDTKKDQTDQEQHGRHGGHAPDAEHGEHTAHLAWADGNTGLFGCFDLQRTRVEFTWHDTPPPALTYLDREQGASGHYPTTERDARSIYWALQMEDMVPGRGAGKGRMRGNLLNEKKPSWECASQVILEHGTLETFHLAAASKYGGRVSVCEFIDSPMNDRAVAESAVVRAEGEGGFKITLWDLDDAGEDEEEKSLGGVTFPGGSETITIAITNMPAQGGRTGEAKHVRFCSEVLATVPGKKPYPKAITTAPGDAAQGEGTWPDIWCPHYKAPYVGNLPMCPFTVFAPSDE